MLGLCRTQDRVLDKEDHKEAHWNLLVNFGKGTPPRDVIVKGWAAHWPKAEMVDIMKGERFRGRNQGHGGRQVGKSKYFIGLSANNHRR